MKTQRGEEEWEDPEKKGDEEEVIRGTEAGANNRGFSEDLPLTSAGMLRHTHKTRRLLMDLNPDALETDN